MKTETIEAVGAAASRTTYAGAGITGWAWITSNEFLGVAGLLVAVGRLIVTWYYRREADRRHAHYIAAREAREQAGSEMRLALMRGSGKPIHADSDDLTSLETAE